MTSHSRKKPTTRTNQHLARNALTNCPVPLPRSSSVARALPTSEIEQVNSSDSGFTVGQGPVNVLPTHPQSRRHSESARFPGYIRPDGRTNRSVGISNPAGFRSQRWANTAQGRSDLSAAPQIIENDPMESTPTRVDDSRQSRGENETRYFSSRETLGQSLPTPSFDLVTAVEETIRSILDTDSNPFNNGSFLNSTEISNELDRNISACDPEFSSSQSRDTSSHTDSRISNSEFSSDNSRLSSRKNPLNKRSFKYESDSEESAGPGNRSFRRRKREDPVNRTHVKAAQRQEKSSYPSLKKRASFKRSGPEDEVKMELRFAEGQKPKPGEHFRSMLLKFWVDGELVEHAVDVLVSGKRNAKITLEEVWLEEKLLFRKH